jgi:hypothetical protein
MHPTYMQQLNLDGMAMYFICCKKLWDVKMFDKKISFLFES